MAGKNPFFEVAQNPLEPRSRYMGNFTSSNSRFAQNFELNGSIRGPEWFESIKIGYKTSLEFYLLNAKKLEPCMTNILGVISILKCQVIHWVKFMLFIILHKNLVLCPCVNPRSMKFRILKL